MDENVKKLTDELLHKFDEKLKTQKENLLTKEEIAIIKSDFEVAIKNMNEEGVKRYTEIIEGLKSVLLFNFAFWTFFSPFVLVVVICISMILPSPISFKNLEIEEPFAPVRFIFSGFLSNPFVFLLFPKSPFAISCLLVAIYELFYLSI